MGSAFVSRDQADIGTMSLCLIGIAHTCAVLVAVQRDGFRILHTSSTIECALSRRAVRISLTGFESLGCGGSGLGESRKEDECGGDGKILHVPDCNRVSKTVERRSVLLDILDMWSKRFEADTELNMGIEGGTIYSPPSPPTHRPLR